ncbi:hypothetical protein DFJ74DRAFT_703850 [Hyaloraphidium curvatum]|nr:hypothetical protein DFJ74DRAFT_703850 [Hyaloraphidium curvatum]
MGSAEPFRRASLQPAARTGEPPLSADSGYSSFPLALRRASGPPFAVPDDAPIITRRGSAGEGQPLLQFLVGTAAARRAVGIARGASEPVSLPIDRPAGSEVELPKAASFAFGAPAPLGRPRPLAHPTALPEAGPASLPEELRALLQPCVDQCVAFSNKLFPALHRTSFIRASAGLPTAIFGGQRPLSLQLAMAAEGALTAFMPSETLRRAAIKGFADLATELLGGTPVLDLGSCLAASTLCGVYTAAGAPARGDGMLARAARTCDALYRSLPRTTPATTSEWLLREQTVRVRVVLSHFDTAAAARTGSKTSAAYFAEEVYPIPCEDSLYDADDPEASFRAVRFAWPPTGPPSITFGTPDVNSAIPHCRALGSAPFHGGSSLNMLLFSVLVHHFLLIVERSGVPQAQLRYISAPFASLHRAVVEAIPSDVAHALASVDAGLFLSSCRRHLGNDAAAWGVLIPLLAADARIADIVGAGGFVATAANRAERKARFFSQLAELDSGFPWAHVSLLHPLLRNGEILLDGLAAERTNAIGLDEGETERRSQRIAGYQAAVVTVAGVLAILGRKFGLEAARVAGDYVAAARAAGVDVSEAVADGWGEWKPLWDG